MTITELYLTPQMNCINNLYTKLFRIYFKSIIIFTERMHWWETSEERKKASLVDYFIHDVMRTPMKFKLVEGVLNVSYNNENYVFTARKSQ